MNSHHFISITGTKIGDSGTSGLLEIFSSVENVRHVGEEMPDKKSWTDLATTIAHHRFGISVGAAACPPALR
jgi:hypothetical protein